MVDAAQELVLIGAAVSRPFGSERATNDRVLWNLTVLGEAAKRVNAQVRDENPSIPWANMAETRDRIVHHYEGVNWTIVTDILRIELPPLLPRLCEIRDKLRGSHTE